MNQESNKIKKFFTQVVNDTLPVISRYREGTKSLNVTQKDDRTLLTDADVEIQSLLVNLIRHIDNESYIIAEETQTIYNPPIDAATNTWIIDPIDGTAQFANPESREYCICICKYELGIPAYALIIMPQLGINSTPLIAEAFCKEKIILINDTLISNAESPKTKLVSCTRSKGSTEHYFEKSLISDGYRLKTSTTSQSIDLLRTACNLTNYSDIPVGKFDIFYRKNQKIWDGAPGFCFNYIVGNSILAENFKPLLPLAATLLGKTPPVNKQVFVGKTDLLNFFKLS